MTAFKKGGKTKSLQVQIIENKVTLSTTMQTIRGRPEMPDDHMGDAALWWIYKEIHILSKRTIVIILD